MGFHPRIRGYAFDHGARCIGARGENKEYLVILAFEFGKRQKITLQPGLHALAGTKHGYTRRVESWIHAQAPPQVVEPLQTLPDEVDPK